MIRFISLAPRAIPTANSYFVEMDSAGILLDTGVVPERIGNESLPRFEYLFQEDIRGIFISHLHLDNVGALPMALQLFPQAHLFMSEPSLQMLPLVLKRGVRLMERLYHEGYFLQPPFFDIDRVDDASAQAIALPWQQPRVIPGTELTAELYHSGHVLGGAGLFLKSGEQTLFYSGDTQLREMGITGGARYPTRADVLVIESTLGGEPEGHQASRKELIQSLAAEIRRALSMGGRILIPVTVLGRAQEIIYILYQMKRNGLIPAVPIFCNESSLEFARQHDRLLEPSEGFKFEDAVMDTFAEDDLQEPLLEGIYLLSSGLLWPSSLSYRLAEQLIPHAVDAIFLVGSPGINTPARLLLDTEPGSVVPWNGQLLQKNCQVRKFDFTGHSNHQHLLDTIGRLQPGHLILVHGGCTDNMEHFADEVRRLDRDIQVHLPEPGMEIHIG